jgi:putative membrane protein insertion efficiency factor
MKIFRKIDQLFARFIILLIKIYQQTISPDHSVQGEANPFHGCKFYPSCSEYGILTFKKKGFCVGIFFVIWRVCRCNPWNKGGVDMPK